MTNSTANRPTSHTAPAWLLGCLLAACGGGGGTDAGTQPVNDYPETEAEAARFLTQATFGPDTADMQRVAQVGYSAWLGEQMAMPASLHRPQLEQIQQGGTIVQPFHRQAMWWKRALTAPDQLRQRMAFALSEILVISDTVGVLGADVLGCTEYYDILVRNAFGSYRELLEQVTLSPQMGKYLSHLRNEKPNPVTNTRPDENYAREIMQLFSIGLFELNQNGTRKTSGGQPIPTYGQQDIIGLAHVFTGWQYAGAPYWWSSTPNYLPMQAWPEYHDTAAKSALGATFAAGQTAQVDLAQALDTLCNHPNVGPFLGKQLIQRLVTSNPSPAYVQRVAEKWADDGNGQRGNLAAVLRAILLDPEARTGQTVAANYGKVKEPLLMMTAIWRALEATSPSGAFRFDRPDFAFAQAALRSRTVFNFFRPDYAPQGEVAAAGLVAPETQILDHTSAITTINQFYRAMFERVLGELGAPQDEILVDLGPLTALAADVPALLAWLDTHLLLGGMTEDMRTILTAHLEAITDMKQRAQDAVYLVASSPEFFVQK